MTDKTLDATVTHLKAFLGNNPGTTGNNNPISELFDYLVESEDQALALIEYVTNPSGPPPILPSHGSIELGFVLYWLDNPPPEVKNWLAEYTVLETIWLILKDMAPATKITTSNYDFLINKIETEAVPWEDGTLIGTSKYEQLDPNWLLFVLNYAINNVDPGSIYPFQQNTSEPATLSATSGSGDPTLAIIGDWGTGYYTDTNGADSPAERVITDLASRQFDYLIHLGDVYYAGTELRPMPGEELDNFINLWPNQGVGRNFTLNSNHEMYGDGYGYFTQALASNMPFSTQNGSSYFALTYGPWLVLCLDSAYYSDAENGRKFYMDGAIGTDSFTQQTNWLEGFRGHTGQIMVMTHHNPVALTTGFTNELFNQVNNALGKMPDVWYWGHIHNGIVYDQLYIGNTENSVPTKGRCCGHAAIPFGNGWGLEKNSNIPYYAHTPDTTFPKGSPRVLNGYASVTLHMDGSFTEKFYEVGNQNAMWDKKWPESEG